MKGRSIEIPIKNCPLCGKDHSHVLVLEEEPVLSMVAAITSAETQDFEVYLTCPNKNDTFKALISLVPATATTIKRVSEKMTID
jgi:hypothetical protein